MLCLGFSSKAGRDKHIVMLDIDGCTETQAMNVATRLITNYNFSDFYGIRSSKGKYHLVCLDKVDWRVAHRIANDFADSEWVKHRSKTKNLVLRVSGKKSMPRMAFCIKGNGKRHRSNAHRLLLRLFYGVNIKRTWHFDGMTKVELHVYETSANGGKGREK